MGQNEKERSAGRVAANDNGAAEARAGAAVTAIARLLGRQIAREQFERLASTNDNPPAGRCRNGARRSPATFRL